MASIQYVVNATDLASAVFAKIAASADGLDKQLEDLSKRVATPEVDLKDAKFTAGILSAAKRIDKLSAMMAEPGADLEDSKFQAEMIKINAQLDRLDARHVTATVDVKTDRNRIGGLMGLLGGAGTAGILGGGSATAQGGGGAAGAAGPIGIAAAVASAAALLPALLPVALGLLTGGGAAGGGLLLGSSAQAQIAKLQAQKPSGGTPADAALRAQLRAQIAAVRQQNAGPLGALSAFTGIGSIAKGVLGSALTGTVGIPGVHFLTGPILTALGIHGAGGPSGPAGVQLPLGRPVLQGPAGFPVPFQKSFLTGLLEIFKQLGKWVKTLGPQLADLFRASLPFLGMFVKFMEKTANILLPVFTQMLKQMQPFLPLIGKGLLDIVKGFAGFLQALGPSGMQASAKIFVALSIVIEYALKGLGIAINWLVEHIPGLVHTIAKWFDWLASGDRLRRHQIAVIFDGIRHDIAHTWDQIFENTIGTVIRLGHDVLRDFNDFRHRTAVVFDGARHDIAHTWDQIWNNTVVRVQNGIADVVRFFKALPGRAINALQGLGTSLYNFGAMALTKLLNGLKSVFSSVWNWFKSLPGKILHAFGFSEPKWAFEAGQKIMRNLLHGVISHKQPLLNAARALARQMHASFSGGPKGGDAFANMALARKMFPFSADQWQPFVNLTMAESGFNRFARNPTSGAYGIAQALPPTKYPFAGQAAGGSSASAQLSWMFNYIAQRYGNPAGAWAHELSAHWYDRGGWLPPGVTMAVNQTGRPERVLSPGQGALVQFGDVNIYDGTDTVLLGQRLSYAITAAGLGS